MGIAIIARPGGMKPPKPPDKGKPAPRMTPPSPPTDDQAASAQPGGKVSREDCLFITSDKHCGNCQMYSPQDGSCSKVVGTMDPEDLCIRYFKAIGDQDNDAGAEPDQDFDDTGVGPPPAAAGQ